MHARTSIAARQRGSVARRPADQAALLAHHYVSALELLRAARRPIEDIVEPTRNALRDAGNRAFALNAYAEAATYYESALELWTDEARGGVLLRYGRALLLAGDSRFVAILREAGDALLAVGNREAAAEAHAFLADGLHARRELDRAYEHIERAVQLVRDAPASPAKVRVLAEWSRLLALGSQPHEGAAIAREAFEAAQELGLTELAARTLGTAGMVRSRFLGDHHGGLEDLRRSFELAISVSSPEAGRAAHNLHLPYWWLGELDAAVASCEEAERLYEHFGVIAADASRAVVAWLQYHTGAWDEALARADAVIAASQAGAAYYEYLPRILRARIRLARGEPDDLVVEDVVRAIDIARALDDRPTLLTTFAHTPRIWFEVGRTSDARDTARELDGLVSPESYTGFGLALLDNAWIAEALGLEDLLRQVLALDEALTDRWRRPYEAVLTRDYVLAAGLFRSIGYVDEGFARLKAGEQLVAEERQREADEQLAMAIAFFSPLGATRYIRQAEALLSAPLARRPPVKS